MGTKCSAVHPENIHNIDDTYLTTERLVVIRPWPRASRESLRVRDDLARELRVAYLHDWQCKDEAPIHIAEL